MRGMLGNVVSVAPWSGWLPELIQVPPIIACQSRLRTGGWKGAGGRGKAVTKGGEDAGDKRKNKTGQKGLVQSPSLGSVLWFTGLEHPHPEMPTGSDRLRAVSVGQTPATCRLGRAGFSGGGGGEGSGTGRASAFFPAALEIAER